MSAEEYKLINLDDLPKDRTMFVAIARHVRLEFSVDLLTQLSDSVLVN